MIGNVIQNRLLVQNDYPVGSALSFILMAGILVAVAVYARAPRHRTADRLMATTTTAATPVGRRPRDRAARAPCASASALRLLPAFTVLAIVYLMIPIAVMIVFSFNEPAGKFNYVWNEFSLDGWLHPFDWPGLAATRS